MAYQTPDPFATFQGNLRRAGTPVTFGIIGVWIVSFLFSFVTRGMYDDHLACLLYGVAVRPLWSPFTFSLLVPNFITIVFASVWIWQLGGSLERAWGSQRYSGVCLASALIWVPFVLLGSLLSKTPVVLAGPWFALTSIGIAWATLNPSLAINFWGIFRIPAWALAAFYAGFVCFVQLGEQSPAAGLFGLIPCALSWWYVQGGFSSGYTSRSFKKRGPDLRMSSARSPLDGSPTRGSGISGWLKAQQEKRKLRKLLKNSGISDKDFRL